MFKKIVSFLAVPTLMAVSGATFAAEGAASSGVDLSPLTNSIISVQFWLRLWPLLLHW